MIQPLESIYDAYQLSKDPIGFFKQKQNQYGDHFYLKLPGLARVLVTSTPSGAAEIFSKPPSFYTAPSPNPIAPLVGTNSLILLNGEQHLAERKKLAPLLNGEILKTYAEPIAQIAQKKAIQLTTPPSANQPFDLVQTTQNITLEIIIKMIMAIDDEAEIEFFRKTILQLLNSFKPSLMFMPFLRFSLSGLSPWDHFVKAKSAFTHELIKTIRTHDLDTKTSPFLAAMVRSNREPGQLEQELDATELQKICDQLITLLVAGHETTAITMFWTIYHIADRPDLLTQLQDEAQSAGGALEQLPLLEACCKEALRLHPVVPVLFRTLKTDSVFFNQELSQGSTIGLVLTLLHQNPEWGEDRHQFNPRRFLGATESIPTNSYYPFGGGMRRCIGSHFAMFEMKVILAQWLQMGLWPRTSALNRRAPTESIQGITMGPVTQDLFAMSRLTRV